MGPPGSGKTVLALRRARLAAQAGRPSSVAVVTYNRMLRRLLSLMNDGDDLPISTMHSFVWHDYKRRTGCEPPNDPRDQYTHDWEAMLESAKGQEFDTVFILELDRFIPFADESQSRGMYMMCTRARDHLFLVHDRPADLTRKAVAALPGPEVLERS